MKVEILSTNLIKPASPTPPNLRSLKISSMDQLQPPIFPAYILYYEANGAETVERSKDLQKSLSETLTLFYPLAGRYIKDKFLVDCNDEGVLYLEAQVGGQLAHLLQGEIKAGLLNHLVPREMESAMTPLLHIQINMFDCGGLAIGLLISHKIADAFTITTFFNAWATTCQATSINDQLIHPSFDLASYFPPRENISGIDSAVIPLKIGDHTVTKRFVFKKEAISNLKDIAARDGACDSTKKRKPSRVVVVTAVIWKALISVAQAKHGHLRASILTHPLNMRGKTAQPVDNSCGNFYTKANARFDGDNESKMELHELVGVFDDALRNAMANCMKPQNGDDLFSMVINSFRELKEEFERGETDIHFFTSWCRFPTYEADFGWGKPIWASSVDKPMEMTELLDNKDGVGIEARVSLEEKNMLLFQHHPDIIAFTSNFSSIS